MADKPENVQENGVNDREVAETTSAGTAEDEDSKWRRMRTPSPNPNATPMQAFMVAGMGGCFLFFFRMLISFIGY
jgi:hypothetical protein